MTSGPTGKPRLTGETERVSTDFSAVSMACTILLV
jgi:hypothetical protein